MAVHETAVAGMTKTDQVAWFARQLPRHPARTKPQWAAATGLPLRTVADVSPQSKLYARTQSGDITFPLDRKSVV